MERSHQSVVQQKLGIIYFVLKHINMIQMLGILLLKNDVTTSHSKLPLI